MKIYKTYNEYLKDFGTEEKKEPQTPEEYADEAVKRVMKKINKMLRRYKHHDKK